MNKLAFILAFLLSIPVLAQPAQQQVYARIRDATDPAAQANVVRPNADAIDPATIYVVDAAGFGYCYDVVNRHWDRMSSHAYADDRAVDQFGVDVLAYTLFYDSTVAGPAARRWYGAQLAVDGVATTTAAPYTGTFNYAYDATNTHWDRVRSDANGALIVNQTTGAPGYGRLQDGDSTVLADVEDTNADGKALTLNPLATMATMYLYNGATLDMGRSGAVGELQTTDVATRPGEDAANDWRKVKMQEIAVWTPAKEASGNIANAAVVVLASKEVVAWPGCCVYLRNKDAANALTDVDIWTSPDNAGTCADANWAPLAWDSCDGLIAGATCVYCFADLSYRYICANAVAAANPNDVDSVEAWLVCNKN